MTKINPTIFKEYDIRGQYPSEINGQTAYALGRAFAVYLKAKKIAVTCDRRTESKKILPDFLAGIKDTGCKIYNLGINSTPTMFFAVGHHKFDGGVSATASHNPIGYAGLKLCDKDGTLIGGNNGLKQIATLAEKFFNSTRKKTEIKTEPLDIAQAYYKFANSIVDLNKTKGFKIILDASSGSGARLADYFFIRLSGKVTKMNFNDGDKYKDHGLNPMLEENRKPAQAEVQKQRADLAIIFDGDGDRCIFIDDKAQYIDPYYINCLLAKIILGQHPKISLVIDARLPQGLSEVIKKYKGKAIVSRAGYTNLILKMQKTKALFGCENSGHYFFNFRLSGKGAKNFIFGDALIPPLLILNYLKTNNLKLSEAVAEFQKAYLLSGEINFKNVDFKKLEQKINQKYSKNKIEKIDGVSVYGKDWFFNLRPSKTEPLVRLNIEARDKKTLVAMTKELKVMIK